MQNKPPGLAFLTFIKKLMITLSNRVVFALNYLAGERSRLLAELAAAKDELAVALSNDAVAAEEIAAARADAEAAQALADEAVGRATELQALVDLDTQEDTRVSAVLDTIELPAQIEV